MPDQLLLLNLPTDVAAGVTPETTVLYSPDDCDREHAAWKATCGPCALAAVLGVPVHRVRRCFPEFPARSYVNPSGMWTALRLARRSGAKIGGSWPTYGLGFVQWCGPWLAPGVPVARAYQHTHWIGMARRPMGGWMVYDVNARDSGGWQRLETWQTTTALDLMATIPQGDGTWFVRWACEVSHAVP